MPRPYFNKSTNELKEIFEQSVDDIREMRLLLEELGHRRRPGAIRLKQEIEHALQGCEPPTTTGATPPQEVATEPPQVPVETSTYQDAMTARPSEYKLVEPKGVQGRPNKWVFNLKTDVRLTSDADTPYAQAYSEVLEKYVAELKREGAGVKRLVLEGGVRLNLDGGGVAYSFPFSGEADLFEGAAITVEYGGSRTDGEVVSLFPGKIILRTDVDLGQCISSCIVSVDNTALLVLLQKRLDEVTNGQIQDFNRDLADAVFQNRPSPIDAATVNVGRLCQGLNAKQKRAVDTALTHTVSYLWGPPGTGKTETLTVLVRALYEAGKRVLICSNTNRAVDQVLLKLCNRWGHDKGGPLDEGHVLRIGQIHLDELREKYSEYVSLEGVVERRSAQLVEERKTLENQLERIERELANDERVLAAFQRLDELKATEQKLIAAMEEAKTNLRTFQQNRQRRLQLVTKLKIELAKVKSKGVIGRLFVRKPETIDDEIKTAERQVAGLADQFHQTETAAHKSVTQLASTREVIASALQQLASYDRKVVHTRAESIRSEKRTVTNRLQEVIQQIEEIEKTVLANTRVLGATITRTFLSYSDLQLFDVVIVDEASMALLPATYFAAGRAKEQCVICGDFRQLPPIIQSKQEVIHDWLASDLFKHAGIVDLIERGEEPSNLVMLDEQWRMAPAICSLISELFYDGRLTTSAQRKSSAETVLTKLFSNSLVIVDTSSLWPFCNRDVFGSRYNLMHSLLARNIGKYLHDEGRVTEEGQLGICTPFAAQARLSRSVLKNTPFAEMVAVSTVHHFQGGEKQIIVLDLPDSIGESYVGVFLQANDRADAGSKLFNVAVSRSEEQLIVLANLTYLNAKLPGTAYLRGILYDMQNRGVIVDAAELLSMYPIDEDLRSYVKGLEVEWAVARTGWFNTADFSQACLQDINNANRHIIIFSGFITPQRTAKYDSIFRQKIAEGVKIRCVTRPPNRNGSIPVQDGVAALKALEAIGVTVDLRSQIHEKIVIIDDQVVWFGSLNPLSHTSRTDEMMLRITGRETVGQVAVLMSTRRTDTEQMLAGKIVEKEYPNCPRCSSWVTYNKGRYGPYLTCSSATCDWKANGTDLSSYDDEGIEAPPCPVCGGEMRVRRSRFGPFFSCARHPDCDGKARFENRNS